MKNDNRNIFSPDLELFNGGSWGGGVRIILAYEAGGFTSILEKKIHFQGYMRGVHGGRLLAYMEERWGAFQSHVKHFLAQKSRFFEMNVIWIII